MKMAKMNNKPKSSKNNRPNKNNNHKKKNNLISNIPAKKEEEIVNDGVIVYEEGITVGELADKLHKPVAEVSKILFMLGKLLTINSSLDDEKA